MDAGAGEVVHAPVALLAIAKINGSNMSSYMRTIHSQLNPHDKLCIPNT